MSLIQTQTGARLICDWLVSIKVKYIFCVPAYYIYPLIKEIIHHPKLKMIVATHELGSGYMADGYARTEGKLGVCLAGAGPGASNMLTAAVTARLDNTPLLFISGDVETKKSGKGGFQDAGETGANDSGIFQQAVTFSKKIHDVMILRETLHRVGELLQKRETVHLSIPKNILLAQCQENTANYLPQFTPQYVSTEETLVINKKLIASLSQAKKILLYIGRRMATDIGIISLKALVETFHLPLVTSLDAKGIFPEDHPLVIGNVAHGGNTKTNKIFIEQKFDLLFCIGIDLNEKNLLDWEVTLRSNNKHIIHLDHKKSNFHSPLKVDENFVVNDLASQLNLLTEASNHELYELKSTVQFRKNWLKLLVSTFSPSTSLIETFSDTDLLLSTHIIAILRASFPANTLIYPDSGTSRVLAGQSWQTLVSQSFFSATTTAPTGWAIAAGIGGKLAKPDAQIIVLTGDISMLMHGLEITTAVRYGLPMFFFVLDNGGNINALKANKEDSNIYPVSQTPTINWKMFAQSIGMKSIAVSTVGELKKVCQKTINTTPILIHLKITTDLNLKDLNNTGDVW